MFGYRNGSTVLLLFSIACGSSPESLSDRPFTTRNRNGIIYGDSPTGARDSAVAALLFVDGGGGAMPFCSATLIAPRVVLTAAHCIIPEFTVANGKVFFGAELGSPLGDFGQVMDIVATAIHPNYDADTTVNDIGIIQLTANPQGVVPIPHMSPARAMGPSDVGADVRMLGFGLTEAPFLGTGPANMERRLQFVADITHVCVGPSACGGLVPRAFAYDHADGGPCSGDSGGPALVIRDGREYLAGINSTIAAPLIEGTQQANCLQAVAGVETTVDAFDDFIDDFVSSRGLTFDACAAGNHDCDVNGICENTHGAFYCTGCLGGYQGNGVTCTDIDECTSGAVCDPSAECVNLPGSYDCNCPDGYASSGASCTDIDECTQGACDPLVACTNLDGSFACGDCPSPYIDVNGDGTMCATKEEVAAMEANLFLVGRSCAALPAPIGWLPLWLLWRRRSRST